MTASLCEDANRAPPSSPLLKAAAVCVCAAACRQSCNPQPDRRFWPGRDAVPLACCREGWVMFPVALMMRM